VSNWNYNSFSVYLLARSYRESGKTEHPDAPVIYLSTGAWNTAPLLTRFLPLLLGFLCMSWSCAALSWSVEDATPS